MKFNQKLSSKRDFDDSKELFSTHDLESFAPLYAVGPLTHYRNEATICWRRFRIMFHTLDELKMKYNIWNAFQSDPIFDHPSETLSLKDYRALTFKRVKRILELNLADHQEFLAKPNLYFAWVGAVGMYNWSLLARKTLLYDFFLSNIMGAGTDKHLDMVPDLMSGKLGGCFCLTEISHGSDTQSMRTTATYIKTTDEFEITTPDFEAAKTWVGNLGETATHASVFAQLLAEDGTRHGLHTFVVPIRDPTSLKAFPGVVIGDMGEKIGLNGLDNGFVMFDHYRIPRDALLDKNGGINKEGKYVSPFKDAKKKMGASLANLSFGRMGIMNMTNQNLQLAITIAIRYSAVRKQFGVKEPHGELPVLEYQTQQCRLFPYLAAAYLHHHFARSFQEDFLNFRARQNKLDLDVADLIGRELHALSCAGKAWTSWTSQRAIQECRESCGGHGYLKISRFGELRDDNDANCTYEGDNNVLLQQTSNFLLKVWSDLEAKEDGMFLLNSTNSLANLQNIRNSKLPLTMPSEDALIEKPKILIDVMHKLLVQLLSESSELTTNMSKEGKTAFAIRNDTQFFMSRTISLLYIKASILDKFVKYLEGPIWRPEEKLLMKKLSVIYGLWCLEEHSSSFLRHGVITDQNSIKTIHETFIKICKDLKKDAVALADVLAPPDFILNSALGHSDGNVYKHMKNHFYSNPDSFGRAEYWKEVTENFRNSKL